MFSERFFKGKGKLFVYLYLGMFNFVNYIMKYVHCFFVWFGLWLLVLI